jgi:hypothetical protein
MVALRLREEDLERGPKNRVEKQVLAWWLRQRTTVSLRWLGERLGMGHYTRVSQAIGVVKRNRDRKLERLRRKLIQLESK